MEESLYDRLPSMLLNADSRSHAHLLNAACEARARTAPGSIKTFPISTCTMNLRGCPHRLLSAPYSIETYPLTLIFEPLPGLYDRWTCSMSIQQSPAQSSCFYVHIIVLHLISLCCQSHALANIAMLHTTSMCDG